MLSGALDRLFARWRRTRTPLELRLYTKASCPLCDEMKAELARARGRIPFTVVEVDIEGDPDLVERYGRSIPVLEINGRPAFKGHLSASELERKVARAMQAAESDGAMSPRNPESRHG